jgi:hypothetical protein
MSKEVYKVLPSEVETLCALNLNNSTCIPEEELKNKIKNFNYEDNIDSESVEKLLERKGVEFQCKGENLQEIELCVMEKLEGKKEIVKYFKPETKGFTHSYWLNNTEIDNVQYHLYSNYKGYYYSNIHMIDLGMFDPRNKEHIQYSPTEIMNIDFVKELKGNGILTENGDLKYYGVVMNTDTSDGRGIHWFSIFIDFTSTPITIEYFNSSGYDIKNKNFKSFLIKMADSIDLNIKPCKFIKVSDIQHQKSTTSNCGVYALYYLWKRLGGTPWEFFQKNKIEDEFIVIFRKYFFRPSIKD